MKRCPWGGDDTGRNVGVWYLRILGTIRLTVMVVSVLNSQYWCGCDVNYPYNVSFINFLQVFQTQYLPKT